PATSALASPPALSPPAPTTRRSSDLPGGTGAAKCGGNYAAGLVAQQEAIANDCDQVAFLDGIEHSAVEELGGMNLFFVYADGTIDRRSTRLDCRYVSMSYVVFCVEYR